MRDFRKFCRPSFSKNPQVGDVSVKLKCGEIGAMTEKEYLKVQDFFEVDSFVGEDSPNFPGNIVVINKETGKQATFSASDYNSIKDQFEVINIVGSKKTPFNNHEYVDLGLPSDTLWATVNVGASSETEVGNYYKFGETTIYDGTDYNTSSYTQSENLPLENDAANANFGGNWHIPTKAQWNELINNTTHTWINDYNSSGVSVVKFAKTDDNSIFIIIPATGSYQNGQLRNPNTGYYWASTQRYGSAEYAIFTEDSYFHADWECAYGHGQAVRAVCDSIEEESLAITGDITCHNDILNINEIFSYQNWLELDDSWNAIDLYGIETFDNEDEVTEQRYVILSNGTTFIIKAEDYSLVSSNWEHVDTIDILQP